MRKVSCVISVEIPQITDKDRLAIVKRVQLIVCIFHLEVDPS
jgi:hypothetical protein